MKPRHFFTTLHSIHQLYTFQHIDQFIEINYLSPTISKLYFGDFFESIQLQEHQANIKILPVHEVFIMESPSHILSYRMKISKEPDSYFTLAYDKIPENRQLTLMTTDTDERTLILFYKNFEDLGK
jgi:hypothetical protein